MKNMYLYIVLLIALLIVWEFAGTHSDTVGLLVSSPSRSFQYLTVHTNSLLAASAITFLESLIGLLLATISAFSIMLVGLYYRRFLEFVLPPMIISQVIPIITLAPLVILIFGVGVIAKIIIATLMCFFPIFVNFYNGIRSIPSEVLDLLSVYRATVTFKVRHVYFPLSTPNIMTGLKISSVLAVIGAIVGEFNGADIGLGKNLFLAAKRLEPELMITSLVLSSILGLSLYALIVLIEFRIGKWYNKGIVN